jgi:hypothetical protein
MPYGPSRKPLLPLHRPVRYGNEYLEIPMAKIITAPELAAIVTGLLIGGETSQIDEQNVFSGFMTDIASVVTQYCGGEVSDQASLDVLDNEAQWNIAIRANDSLPPDGGVWAPYDIEGSLRNDCIDQGV